MFTSKKWLKNFCSFIASASLACCFCSLTNAVAPDTNTKGKQVGNTSISKNETTPSAEITLANSTSYTGSAQSIISSIDSVKLGGNTISDYISEKAPHLWLRVADSTDGAFSTSWVQYTGNDSLSQRTNVGTYYVYYYIDGNGNCNDSGSDT